MLVEKEIIAPGSYWYTDEATGLPRKLDVTPELCKHWHDQGSKMLAAGLHVPVPFEHDFNAHPMTPKEKLLNNAGEVKEYRMRGNTLFGVVDVQDPDARRKIGHSIRWTSPWINSFTDGDGRTWNNVISHLALTTRPRITKQAPFGSIAAALSMATHAAYVTPSTGQLDPKHATLPSAGFCLSRAGRLVRRKKSKRLCPRYPIAFSLWSGAALADDDMPPKKKNGNGDNGNGNGNGNGGDDDFDMDFEDDDFDMGDGGGGGNGGNGDGPPSDGDPTNDDIIDMPPYNDPKGDVSTMDVLCDLLSALGINCENTGDEATFKRSLYTAAMTKIHELTAKAQDDGKPKPGEIGKGGPNDPNAKPSGAPSNGAQPNPLIQQEQQPMYMSLEEINKLPEPMKGVALAMYTENQKLRAEMEANARTANSLRDGKLKEATAQRTARVTLLSKLSPRVKADLEAMAAMPSMALSMGEGGAVVDPMAQTLAVLEKGLADMPRLLTTEMSALSVAPQPTDGEMSQEATDKMADDMARMMGCSPERKKAS